MSMTPWCRICGQVIESSGGTATGHDDDDVCASCAALPRVTVATTEADQILGFLLQSCISADDIYQLCTLLDSPYPQVVDRAGLVLQVALVKPKRDGRREYLTKHRPQLQRALDAAGLGDVL